MSDTTPTPTAKRSNKPVVKVAAAGVGGAITTIVVAIIEAAGGHVDPSTAAAIATVVSFGAGYVTPPR